MFKSIFRKMRRYFCKLLEDQTGYNRKEKSLNIKHRELIKCLAAGMPALGFSSFNMNMPFYFGAFAYPSDMRKILEESKQHYRNQNEVLTQAMYIVGLVDNCFNRFSKKILDDLLAVPQFSFLINYYLSNVDDLGDYPKPFQNCYEILTQSKASLTGYSESGFERQRQSQNYILKEEFFLFTKSDSL